jgi:Ser/Thr protein kinase RdoA (MazF antagonist)
MVRIPKPSYLLSQAASRRRPDVALYPVMAHLAGSYRLGQVRTSRCAPRSNSPNFFLTTAQGKFVVRRHNLSEEAVAYEYQVLEYLQKRGFPAPRMSPNSEGQAWVVLDGALYSVYEFAEGYCPASYLWSTAARRGMIARCGRTLGEYHRAVAGLAPTTYKWNGYRSTEHRRWREGDWFRQVLADIRPLLQKPAASCPDDEFVRSGIDGIEQMLELESVVEQRSDLSKVVIHGDYSPWNVLFRPSQPPLVLDFNEPRLDLKIYDVILATFWFAWRGDRLDQDRALAFQAGYCETGQLHEVDIAMAGVVFQWIMARSMTERLHTHYLQQRPLIGNPAGMEKRYRMCIFSAQQPQVLVAGLRGMAGQNGYC